MSMGQTACPHASIVHKLEKDMYHGNGKPGITTRVEVLEGNLETLQGDMQTVKRMFWALILLGLTILGGVIAKH